MNTNKIDLIKAEVERLQNELIQEKKKGFGSDIDDACILELQNVLTYIDSLQEEPVSEDLEKAAVNAFKQIVDSDKNNFLEIFKAGSEWQKQQTISKASKWIDENAAKYLVDRFVGSTRVVGIDTSITEDFRKDMEE
jgi:kynurenine formamidase